MKDSIKFVIITIVPVQNCRPHGLFGHLTLIHVTGRLVVVYEWNVLRQNREHVSGTELGMRAFWKIDVHEKLFGGTYPLYSIKS